MKGAVLKYIKYFPVIVLVLVFITSILLSLHNASIYVPRHGFDGVGHTFYIEYITKNNKLPPSGLDWETHQSPLYYVLGSFLMKLSGTIKTAQFMNTFILWGIIGVVGTGLFKLFKNRDQAIIGMLSLAALPMMNIFPPMVTNELLSTFWIVNVIVACLFLFSVKNTKEYLKICLWILLSLILGIWTKVSIITVLPVVLVGFGIFIFKTKLDKKISIGIAVAVFTIFILSAIPVFSRAQQSKGPSNIVDITSQKIEKRDPSFFYRLDWIPKLDMYNTQYYSMIGGAWNSFWSDGHNAVTPFVAFHKKALILWLLGFILLPLSLFGLYKLFKEKTVYGVFLSFVGVTMLGIYVYYNIVINHYSAARLTYEMGIIVPYAFGIAAATKNKKLKWLVFALLLIQFVIMVSFFWIESWWHVTK